MNINLISVLIVVLLIGILSHGKASEPLEFGYLNYHKVFSLIEFRTELIQDDNTLKGNYLDDVISEPIEIDWQVLTAIDYELQYYDEFDMEMYTPIFSNAVKRFTEKKSLSRATSPT